jgi:hypothetical protein
MLRVSVETRSNIERSIQVHPLIRTLHTINELDKVQTANAESLGRLEEMMADMHASCARPEDLANGTALAKAEAVFRATRELRESIDAAERLGMLALADPLTNN